MEQEVETADPVDDNAPEEAPTISEVDAAYFEVGPRATGLAVYKGQIPSILGRDQTWC